MYVYAYRRGILALPAPSLMLRGKSMIWAGWSHLIYMSQGAIPSPSLADRDQIANTQRCAFLNRSQSSLIASRSSHACANQARTLALLSFILITVRLCLGIGLLPWPVGRIEMTHLGGEILAGDNLSKFCLFMALTISTDKFENLPSLHKMQNDHTVPGGLKKNRNWWATGSVT